MMGQNKAKMIVLNLASHVSVCLTVVIARRTQRLLLAREPRSRSGVCMDLSGSGRYTMHTQFHPRQDSFIADQRKRMIGRMVESTEAYLERLVVGIRKRRAQ